jgi:hypothetical protein
MTMKPEDTLKETLDYWGGDCECEGGVVCRSCSADKALVDLVGERDNWKRDYQEACKCVAEMHGAAVGGWGNAPKRGIVEDIEDVVKERDAMKAAYDTMFRVAEKAAAENKALRAGAPLGPIVGTETILNQELELKKLRADVKGLRGELDKAQQIHEALNANLRKLGQGELQGVVDLTVQLERLRDDRQRLAERVREACAKWLEHEAADAERRSECDSEPSLIWSNILERMAKQKHEECRVLMWRADDMRALDLATLLEEP